MTVVLMYHALYPGSDVSAIDAEDLPYAVSAEAFSEQLDRICALGDAAAESVAGAPAVVLTFDDGHASNHELALPLLQARGLQADIFITTGFIDQRAGFCSRSQVAELAAAGMRIGAHGVSHRFFDDMNPAEAGHELRHSREVLQSITGQDVTSMSFPGGRYTEGVAREARQCGYRELHGSRTGRADLSRSAERILPRVAVRNSTGMPEFERMIRGDRRYFATQQGRDVIKTGARRLLGNRLYHGLYRTFATR